MLVAGVTSAAVFNGDILLLVAVADRKEVAIYAAAWRIAAGLSIFNSAVASALLPYIMTSDHPRRDLERLARAGLGAAAFILLLLPGIVPLGLTILGSAGRNAGGVLALLVAAFALDTFISLVFQSYIRVGRTALPVANVILELALMASVTIGLRSHGALAPALGQLVARAVGVVVLGGPIVLERSGRLGWFDPRPRTTE
jgi:O-antigen/teichoic acid export membrane protein